MKLSLFSVVSLAIFQSLRFDTAEAKKYDLIKLTEDKHLCWGVDKVKEGEVTLITFCMLQKDLGQNIFLSSKRCSPTSRRLGSRSMPANLVLAHTNLTIYVITSLMKGLCPYLRKSRQFKPSQFQKNCKQLRQFIGMINFYRDMWQKRFELLAPLTSLTSKNVKYKWKDEHQNNLMRSNV